MSKVLKRAYQFLLLSYPTVTRTERGSVELDTLMEVSRPNRVLPRFGEARAIVVEGIRERVRRNGGTKYLNGAFSGWVVIGLLLLSLIDPRILIGLSIALLTPAVAMVMVISTYGSGSLSTKLTFPGMCLGVMVLLWMRVRVLVRRTLASINQV
jgi:hypothetical protein